MTVEELYLKLSDLRRAGHENCKVYYMGALVEWEEINNVDIEKDFDQEPGPVNIILLTDQ